MGFFMREVLVFFYCYVYLLFYQYKVYLMIFRKQIRKLGKR